MMELEGNERLLPPDQPQLAETVGGFYWKGHIYLRDATPHYFIKSYSHEVGHSLGYSLSFRNGNVLRPPEVLQAKLALNTDEISLLHKFMTGEEKTVEPGSSLSYMHNYHTVKELTNRALRVYSKGYFTPQQIRLHAGIDRGQMEAVLESAGIFQTGKINPDGSIAFINTRAARNSEMSSLATEFAVLRIMANTVQTLDPTYEFTWKEHKVPVYQRAQKIIQAIYRYPGFTPPSWVDAQKAAASGLQSSYAADRI